MKSPHLHVGIEPTKNCRTPSPPADDFRCDIFTRTLFVAWTGEVLSCCHDLAGANVVGDFLDAEIADWVYEPYTAPAEEPDAEKAAHQAVQNSRSWRVLQGFQRVRKGRIPEGSRRETNFQKIFGS